MAQPQYQPAENPPPAGSSVIPRNTRCPPSHPPSTSRGAHLPLWAAGRGRHRAGHPAGWRHRSRPPGSGGHPGERADTGGGTHDGEGAEVVTDVTTVLFFFPSLPQNPPQVMLPARGAHGAGGTPWGRGRGRDPGATSLQRAAGGCGLQEGGGAATSFLGCPRDRANGHPAVLGRTGSTGQESTPGCGVTRGWHSRVTRGAVCEPLRCPLAPNQHHQYHTSACTSATSTTPAPAGSNSRAAACR